MGVDLLNCMPYYPNEGSNFSHLGEPSKEEIAKIQKEAQEFHPPDEALQAVPGPMPLVFWEKHRIRRWKKALESAHPLRSSLRLISIR